MKGGSGKSAQAHQKRHRKAETKSFVQLRSNENQCSQRGWAERTTWLGSCPSLPQGGHRPLPADGTNSPSPWWSRVYHWGPPIPGFHGCSPPLSHLASTGPCTAGLSPLPEALMVAANIRTCRVPWLSQEWFSQKTEKTVETF